MKNIRRSYLKFLRISGLGVNLLERCKIASWYILFAIKRRLGLKPSTSVHHKVMLNLNGYELPFFLKNQLDFDVMWDAFIEDQYSIDGLDPRVIIDLGSNVGATVVKFHAQYPDAQIIAVEPDPSNFESLQLNTESFRDKVTLYQHAIHAEHDKVIQFFIGTSKHWSSSIYSRSNTGSAVEVRTITLAEIVRGHDLSQVDILKFDVEGAEYLLFKDCPVLEKLRYVTGEVHEELMPITEKEFLELFQGFEILNYAKPSAVVKMQRKK